MSEFSQAQREELRDIMREVVREVLSADFVADFARRTIDNNETSRRMMRRNEPYIRALVREVIEEREAATTKTVPGYNQILLDTLRRVEEEVLNSMQRSAEGQKIIDRHARRR